jgi:hypothetical protein
MKRQAITASLLMAFITCLSAFSKDNKGIQPVRFSDSAIHQRSLIVIKKDAVKLYPNPTSNGMITISSDTTATLHFYVFDVEGTLLHQVVLKDKQKHTIHQLKKGMYVYDAFLNDESIEHGKIIVK